MRTSLLFLLLTSVLTVSCCHTGLIGTGGTNEEYTDGQLPVIELKYESRMFRNAPSTQIFADGRIVDRRYGTTSSLRVSRATVSDIANELTAKGFFKLNEGLMSDQLRAQASNSLGLQGVEEVPPEIIIDAATVSLSLRTASATKEISFYALEQHCTEYPAIRDFQTFKDCITIVERVLPQELRRQ